MKSNIIELTTNKNQFEAIYQEVDKCAQYADLSKKDALHLRLLTEELVGMIGEVLGDYEASVWIENEKKAFEIHLEAQARVGSKRREQLLSVAKDGKNMATKGVMGKIRRVMEICFMGDGDEYCTYMNACEPYMYGMDSVQFSHVNTWRLNDYLNSISQNDDTWDELEKSIVVKLADDILVGVQNNKAEVVIKKNFDK